MQQYFRFFCWNFVDFLESGGGCGRGGGRFFEKKLRKKLFLSALGFIGAIMEALLGV